MGKSVIALDTDHIKEYVFATGTLKEIRGASALLDELNREGMEKAIQALDPSCKCIYANGGQGMFQVEEKQADACIQTVERLYRDNTITSSVTGAKHVFNNAHFQDDFKTLSYKLRLNKDSKHGTGKPVTHSLLKTCESCGQGYANCLGDGDEVICISCHKKREKNYEIQKKIEAILSEKRTIVDHPTEIWERLLKELMNDPTYDTKEKRRPEDMNILGQLSTPSGYIGLLYADGNKMGEKLENVANAEELEKFSGTVDNGIFQAVVQAVKVHLHPRQDKYFPFDILLLGGDDLVMLTVADKAIETAMIIEQEFRKCTRKWKKPLSLSIGVAIAHAKFPFGNLLNLAEDLLKFAKKELVKRERETKSEERGLLNFQVVSASSSLSFKEDYKQVYVSKDEKPGGISLKFVRTLRPYYADHPSDPRKLEILIKRIREMKSNSFPKTKLQTLHDVVLLDYEDSILPAMAFQNRLKSDQRQLLRDIFQEFAQNNTSVNNITFPWFRGKDACYSPFVDIAELYDFIK